MSRFTTIEPELVLDTRGSSCPLPVLKATRGTEGLAPGTLFQVISDCPGTHSDLQAWARQTGRELLDVADHADGGRIYTLRNRDRWQANAVLDMRGRPCPAPVVEAERRLHGMAHGQVLKLLSDCRGFADDMDTWASSTGREVLGTVPGPAGSEVSYIRC